MKHSMQKLRKDTSGSTAMIFSLALVPLLIAAGAALDYSRSLAESSRLQNALDSAVLAGASLTAKQILTGATPESIARTTFAAHYDSQKAALSIAYVDGIVRGTASLSLQTMLMQVIGVSKMEIAVNSAATNKFERQPGCFMAMHPTRKHTLELDDTVSVYAPNCNIYGNSDDEDDVVDPHKPENFLTGKSVQAVGYGHHYLQNVKPPLEYAPERLADPLASLSIPTDGTCSSNKRAISTGSVTLNPGVYCKGLTIKNGANVTLTPGTYFIEGGVFHVSKSTLSGDSVTIILADNNSTIEWDSSIVRLSAPKTGPLAGIVVTGQRTPTSHNLLNSTIDLHGTVYLPQGAFQWTNVGTPTINAKWTAWVIDGVSWNGSGTIKINFNPDSSDIPLPAGLRSVIPRAISTTARLIKF